MRLVNIPTSRSTLLQPRLIKNHDTLSLLMIMNELDEFEEKVLPPLQVFADFQKMAGWRRDREKQKEEDVTPDPRWLQQQAWLQRVVQGNQDETFTVNAIAVKGANKTKESVFEKAFKPLFDAKTLGEVMMQTQHTVNRLNKLGIFSNVDVTLDTAKDGDDKKLDVLLHVKEKPRIWAKTGTELAASEGNLNTCLVLRNVFGGGETLEASGNYGMETEAIMNKDRGDAFAKATTTSFNFLFAKPVDADPEKRLELGVSRVDKNYMLDSSHMELVNGLNGRYKWMIPSIGHAPVHAEAGYNLQWRHIHNLSPEASGSIRGEAGHSLKSSISTAFSRDERNDSILPTSGTFHRMTFEIAGVPPIQGDANFVKSEVESSISRTLTPGWSTTITVRAGGLIPLFGQSRINDRFFLGGPLSVRGYKYHGLGPKDGKDALGGDCFWAGGASLFTPLPYLQDKPLKGHVFVNAGGLGRLQGGSLTQTMQQLMQEPSSSAGFGLVMRFSIVRLEVNYCLPLTLRQGDEFRNGWQMGLGLSFL